jgi:hypothetical protein
MYSSTPLSLERRCLELTGGLRGHERLYYGSMRRISTTVSNRFIVNPQERTYPSKPLRELSQRSPDGAKLPSGTHAASQKRRKIGLGRLTARKLERSMGFELYGFPIHAQRPLARLEDF